jgi:hypothetical protein
VFAFEVMTASRLLSVVSMRTALASLLAASALTACTDDTTLTSSDVGDPGALIKMQLSSQVGVLLDDIPAGPLREAAAAAALAQPAQFWTDRASRQVRLTYYKLVFRGQYYASNHSSSSNVKGPLPLPQKSVWNVALTDAPYRVTSAGHDFVAVDYAFDTTIVSDAASPAQVEPALAAVGGTWTEQFNLPTDPDLLLERTGFACMDENEYPAGSVFEENTWYFYDDSCKPSQTACHITASPTESCVSALGKHTGAQKVFMQFTRLAYDASVAAHYRVGSITNASGADLSVVQPAMVDERKIAWKFFAPGSCEIAEGVIGALGWRRVMMFSAVVQNDGTAPVHLGNVTDPTNPYTAAHDFEFSQCHQHYHFSHYGNFNYDGAPGSKRAFCLEDTNRFHNDETTPLTAVHQTCEFQGIGAGWGDEYEFGIPGQWVDITTADTTTPHALTFDNNPDDFLCEGTPVTDASGNLIFDPTTFLDSSGDVEGRVRCNQPASWHANNVGSVQVSSPGGSFVTEPCQLGQIGPNRECGFAAQASYLHSCTPGSTVSLTCTNTGPAQTLRTCEQSAVLGLGVACTYGNAISNTIVSGSTAVTFTCPQMRDGTAGGYSVYAASVVPSQGDGSVSCTGTGW